MVLSEILNVVFVPREAIMLIPIMASAVLLVAVALKLPTRLLLILLTMPVVNPDNVIP